jgi:hypothetical protein
MGRRKKLDLPPGITRRQYEAWQQKQAALGQVNDHAFPGPLGDAIAPQAVEALGFILQPVSSLHLVALQRVDSPLLRAISIIRKNAGKSAKEIQKIAERMDGGTFEEIVEMFFVFTRTPQQLCELLAAGPQYLRAAALKEVATRVAARDIPKLAFAAGAHFAHHYATVVAYEQEKPDGSFPSAPASPVTGSAGAPA